MSSPRVERMMTVAGRAPFMATIDLLERVVPTFGRDLRDRLESRMLAIHVALHDQAMSYVQGALSSAET